MPAFSRFLRIHVPETIMPQPSGKYLPFEVTIDADGEIPFPQVILYAGGRQHLLKDDAIEQTPGTDGETPCVAKVPAGLLGPGEVRIQTQGCRKADWRAAGGSDWIKEFRTTTVSAARSQPQVRTAAGSGAAVTPYFGIHKHMHQPYYNTTDPNDWEGEKDGIFSSRVGNYTRFIPAAVCPYIEGLPVGAG